MQVTTRFITLMLLVACSLNAQVIQWTRQFGTRATDYANAVTTAPNAIYVVGVVVNGAFEGAINAGGRDPFVSKFDLSGTHLWTRQFGTSGTDEALGVTANSTGVYVVGQTFGALQGANAGARDAFVRKYDTEGNELWTRQFGGPGEDSAHAAAVDASGLYVVGEVVLNFALPGQSSAGGSDAFIRKYDFNGNETWTRQFGTSNNEKGYGVAADSSGVYITGETNGALGTAVGGTDYFLRKYDAAGTAVWTRQFGSPSNDGAGYGGGVAVNSTGVYVTGCTTGTFAGQTKVGGLFDAFATKFDLNGNPQWTRQIGTTGEDWGYGIAASGQWIYVTGEVANRFRVWRFDANGNETGAVERGTSTTPAFGIATDSSGAYAVGGVTGNHLGQTPIGDQDPFVLKIPHPPEITGVSDAFNGQTGVAPTTWIAIYGSNLSLSTRTWDGAIDGTNLPESLDGVNASINGKPATMFFISPSQVNVLGPLDDATGNVQLTLTTAAGASLPFQVNKANYRPAFYAPFGESTGLRVTAVALDGTLVGKVGVDPRVLRAARPGEIVQFFATGFGPTSPPTPSNTLFMGAPDVVNRPRITIGGREAAILGNGNLVSPGLFQFNITIPDVADGDHPIIATTGGASSPANVFLTVRR